MKTRLPQAALILATAVYCGIPGVAHSDPAAADEDTVEMDEIIVTAPRTVRQVRRELRTTEDRLVDIFNEKNDDDDLDIVCRKRAPIGSQIPRRSCATKSQLHGLSEMTIGEDPPQGLDQPWTDSAAHNAALRRKMMELAKASPEFRTVLVQRVLLRRELSRLTETPDNQEK